jgi:hypothetical protein
MILSDAKNLETLVVDELESSRETAKSPLTEKLDAETIETISSVIEQQTDPESFESTSYSINLPGYESSSYTGKTYYEMANEGETVGASMAEVQTDYEHKFLQEAQQIASQIQQGSTTNHPFVEAQIDTNIKYIKDSIKIISPAIWKLMYEGKITFN